MSPTSAFESPTFDRNVSIRVNEAIGSASISPSGRDVVLASRNGLYIIDLDDPYSPPRHVPHRSPWEVADVQWSPFASRDYWIVSTANQKALVWNLHLSARHAPIEHVLHAHQRAITDINFSAHHPDILATCAVDSFVHCWDLRQPQRPAISLALASTAAPIAKFADWDAGATQVKWNRQDSNIVASSHDKYLRIWDRRKGAVPLQSIEAHLTKIYGIDWNRTQASGILTCSLDHTIKLWDYSVSPNESGQITPQKIIRTPYPVWRARHTPFGWGVLAMPQRGNYNLHLFDGKRNLDIDAGGTTEPVQSFEGHDDQVKEFLWRSRGGVKDGLDDRDFQLVSWGMDRNLQLHKISPEILKPAGFEKGQAAESGFALSRRGATYKSFRVDEKRDEGKTQTQDAQKRSHLTKLVVSAGMSKAPLPQVHTFQERSFMTTSGGMQGRITAGKSMNPIAWMEGVKIGKRESAAAEPKSGSKALVPTPTNQWNWDSPESLGDEITYVGGKFKKVTFEEVDVSRRSATVSLHGPWGQEGKAVFMRVSFKFPREYPKAASPEYRLEKTTSAISDDTLTKLHMEIDSIVKSYRSKRKGCLEAVVSYVLGERGLEESLSWASESEETGLRNGAEDSSSDEEDDVGEDFVGTAEQDMEMSGNGILGSINANANVPLPIGCGAVWAQDGRLIRFCPPKPEPKPLFSLATLRGAARYSKNQGIFEKFGRLQTDSPEPRKKSATTEGEDDDDDSSVVSLTSSSTESSSSSEGIAGLPSGFQHATVWRGGALRFQKTSQNSSIAPMAKAITGKPKSIVYIHDLGDILPSKRKMAEQYEVFGDGPTVCAHNADVARQNDCEEHASIWNMIGLILANKVPLESMPQTLRNEDILVVAKRALVRIKRKDSGLDLAFDGAASVSNPKFTGRVKWGQHPFASAKLIPKLFDQFEKLGDVQMLAMLSCILAEPPMPSESATLAQKDPDYPALPMVMKTPAFSLSYYPSAEVAWSLYQPKLLTPPAPNPAASQGLSASWERGEKKIDGYGSMGSSNGPWGSDNVQSDPATPYSVNATPPLSRSNTFKTSATTSFSSSPEQHHHSVRRTNSNLANAIASFPRPLVSSSPPAQLKSRPSEVELSSSAPTSGVTWGKNTYYGSDSERSTKRGSHRSKRHLKRYAASNYIFRGANDEDDEGYDLSLSHRRYSDEGDSLDSDDPSSDEGYARPVEEKKTVQIAEPSPAVEDVAINVTLKNQDQFNEEAALNVPLLPRSCEWLYRNYRRQYANQLLSWGLPIQASEVLKFNGLAAHYPPDYHRYQPGEPAPDLALGRKQPSAAHSQPHHYPHPSQPPPKGASSTAATAPLLSFNAKQFKFNPEASAFIPSAVSTPDVSLAGADGAAAADADDDVSHIPPLGALGDITPALPPPRLGAPAFSLAYPPGLAVAEDGRGLTVVAAPRGHRGRTNAGGEKDGDSEGGDDGGGGGAPPLGAGGSRTCVVCWTRLRALFAFCERCGHVAHAECAGGFGGGREEEGGDGADGGDGGWCRIGCGCKCRGGKREEGEWVLVPDAVGAG